MLDQKSGPALARPAGPPTTALIRIPTTACVRVTVSVTVIHTPLLNCFFFLFFFLSVKRHFYALLNLDRGLNVDVGLVLRYFSYTIFLSYIVQDLIDFFKF